MTKNKKKDYKIKSDLKEEQAENKSDIPSYFSYVFGILLLVIFALSLYIRTVMPYDSVFRNGVVAFASDDAVFHMRLVENTLHNFPHQIFYDAFTIYPYGATIHWGPLFTQMIATLSLIAGMGSYNMQTVNIIGAFFPSVLGALVVFPVYFLGKSLAGRGTGLIAAFMIAVLPGQFLSRSTLGFTDNHVAEVFFSSLTLAFFTYALVSGKKRKITFSGINLKDKSVLLSILAGVMLAGYQLSWPGAPFFAMIILIFVIIQYMIDDIRGASTDYIAIAAIPMFLIDLISVLPYFDPGRGFAADKYSWLHVLVPLGSIILTISLSAISAEIKKRGYEPYYYPISLGGFFVLGMLIMKIILPGMFNAIVYTPRLIFQVHTGGANTIAEASSILERPGMLWSNFPIVGPLRSDDAVLWLIIAVLVVTGYNVIKRQRPAELLFLIWTAVMLLAMYGQNRWAYYFAINAALLAGYAGGQFCEAILKWGGWKRRIDKNGIGISHILSMVIAAMLVLFFAYPSAVATVIGENGQQPISRYGGGEPSGGGFSEWLETMTWMRDNTPDPGLDYFAIYDEPRNDTYPYPETAYGVMSWWDYGHIITYWAHRIPNANPFQSGIGGGTTHAPGAATFLTAKSEEEASGVLNALGINGRPGARYIVSDSYMAYGIMDVFGIWNLDEGYRVQIQTDQGPQVVPSSKYYDNMEAKLHIFDGNSLKNYRFVHESPTNPNTEGGYAEQQYKYIYNILYGGNIPIENSGLVKVFEYVKGAKITGRAPANATVTLSNTIKTNIGRTIQYSQTTLSDGRYQFTVPYSTEGPISRETQFDTGPTGAYNITAGNVTKQTRVREEDVLNGGTITLDILI